MSPVTGEWPSVVRRLQLPGLTCYAILLMEAQRPIGLQLYCNSAGSIERGLLHCLGRTVTEALRHGVPLADIISDWRRVCFDPAGITGDATIRSASSITDYLAQWLEGKLSELQEAA
ncbi:MAG: hypothetical protein ABFD89_00915 [Bryobacteraceae bacterium]